MFNIATENLLTSVTYTANGTQKVFTIPFDYLRKSFVYVTLNGSPATNFEIINRTIEFVEAPVDETLVTIYRSTPTERLVSWADASVLKASDMNIQQVQELHIMEEFQDWLKLNSIVLNEDANAWEGRQHKLRYIADPEEDHEVVTKHYMETVQGGFVTTNTELKDEVLKQVGIAIEKSIVSKNEADRATQQANLATDKANIVTERTETTITKAAEANRSSLTAIEQATIATAKATLATEQAAVATAKTIIAVDNANVAVTKAEQASVSATTSIEQCNEATRQAQLAREAAAKAVGASQTLDEASLRRIAKEAALSDYAEVYYRHVKPITVSKTSVTLPQNLVVAIGNSIYTAEDVVTVSISDINNRSGKDVYIYACVPTSGTNPTFVVSMNSTVPSGYTANTSRKIGGFHCLCADVGTISGHALSGYRAGDILPYSLWDLLDRAESDNEGMVKNPFTNTWIDIYLPSWDGSKLTSVYQGVIADGTSTKKWHGEAFCEQFMRQGKHIVKRNEFMMAAKGSNEGTNIKNSADPNTTGGHTDTANRRMISDIGVEDACGALWQFSDELGFAGGSGWTDSVYNRSVDPIKYGQSYGTLYRLRLGGCWGNGGSCGSRCVSCSDSSASVWDYNSSRGSSEPRKIRLS